MAQFSLSSRLAGLASGGNLRRWLLLFPALGWLVLFFVAPFVLMAILSLMQYSDHKIVTDLSFDNYIKFFGSWTLLSSLWRSLEVSVLTAVFSLLIAYPLAYILAFQVSARWQRAALLACIIPFWTSYLVRSYSWLLVLSKDGVMNTFFMQIGVIDEPINVSFTRAATIIGFVHFFTMLLTLTIYSNLVQIPKNIRLAAADLGAAPFSTFIRVILPISMPGVSIGVFLTIVVAIGDFVTPQILGGGQELLLPQAIMLQIQRHFDFPMASAFSIILMLTITLIFLVFSKRLKMDQL